MAFATKPKLAQAMLERAVKAGLPFAWVAADEVYGQNPGLRDWLEQEHIGYVMAVPCSELITVTAGRGRADALARLVPGGAWQRLSCADRWKRGRGCMTGRWSMRPAAVTSCWSAARCS